MMYDNEICSRGKVCNQIPNLTETFSHFQFLKTFLTLQLRLKTFLTSLFSQASGPPLSFSTPVRENQV